MTKQIHGRTWCGIGIEHPKHEVNLGGLWRSAVCLGADFIFTVGDRYRKQASDTLHAPGCVPCFSYTDLDDFNDHRPMNAPLVGVELADGALPLEDFTHPRQAVYLLGPEDGSLSARAFDSEFCLNVASAGSVVLYDRRLKLR